MNNKLCIYTFYSNFNKELIIRYVATFYVKVIVVSTVICQCLVIWLAGGKWIFYYPRFMTLYVKLYSLRVCIMVSLALNRCLCLYTVILRQYIYIYGVYFLKAAEFADSISLRLVFLFPMHSQGMKVIGEMADVVTENFAR